MSDADEKYLAARDTLAESGSQNGPYQPYSSASFKTGADWAYAYAREEILESDEMRALFECIESVEARYKEALIKNQNASALSCGATPGTVYILTAALSAFRKRFGGAE